MMPSEDPVGDPLVAERLAAWLCTQMRASDVLIEDLAIPKQGFSNETWYADAQITDEHGTSGRRLVIRLEPESSRLFLETDVQLQWRMMQAIGGSGIAVPPLVAHDHDGVVVGRPLFVMEHVDGVIPSDLPPYNLSGFMTGLTAPQRGRVWRNGLEVLARIHALDWRECCPFLDRRDRGEPGLPQYLDWLSEWFELAASDREVPLLRAALTELRSSMPRDAPVGIVWGDARPGNIIYSDDLDVAAVIDWEMAALGPGEVDLAWWLFMDRFYSEGMNAERLAGLPNRRETIDLYEQFAHRPTRDLPYYEILAAFRMALVVSRSASSHVRSGRLDPSTTMHSANPAARILAELLGEEVPDLSPDFVNIIRQVTRTG